MNLQIRVFSNQSAYDNRKVLFERVVSLPFGVKAPFDSLIDDFKFLFGDSCIVDFKVS